MPGVWIEEMNQESDEKEVEINTSRQPEDGRGLDSEFKLWMLCLTYGACSGCANTLIRRSSKALGNSHEFITLGAQLIDSMREHIVTCQKKKKIQL